MYKNWNYNCSLYHKLQEHNVELGKIYYKNAKKYFLNTQIDDDLDFFDSYMHDLKLLAENVVSLHMHDWNTFVLNKIIHKIKNLQSLQLFNKENERHLKKFIWLGAIFNALVKKLPKSIFECKKNKLNQTDSFNGGNSFSLFTNDYTDNMQDSELFGRLIIAFLYFVED